MKIIYQPKGAAREYAAMALNIYKGCTHGCRYCYAPAIMRVSASKYWASACAKKDILRHVRKDARSLAGLDCPPEILISFIGDPYQPAEQKHGLTRGAIKILIENNLPFTILTKGGRLASRDFDLLDGYDRARFGTSMTWFYQDDADKWEPHAASIKDRLVTIAEAKARGIRTWVSLEPVIDPDQALLLIEIFNHLVDFWFIGKINHRPGLERMVDWPAFYHEARERLEKAGAKYQFKKSIMACI